MGRAEIRQSARQTRSLIGFVSDLGGAAVALSMLIAGLVGVGSVIVGLANNRPSAVFFGGGVVFGVGLGTVLMQLAHVRRSSSLEDQRGYRWIEAVFTYSIDPDDRHLHAQTVDVKIRALRDGVRTFTNQYRWTGSGIDNGPIVKLAGHSLTAPNRQSLGWRSYDVHLDPALRRGQTTTISVVQELRDEGQRFEPFLAKAVHEAMDHLILRVQLPPGLVPEQAWGTARDGAGPQARVEATTALEIHDDGRGAKIEWLVLNPAKLNYELAWSYREGMELYDVPLAQGRGPNGPAV